MPTWIIEPRDGLIARDGRPFGPDPGVRAESLPFPLPSVTAGGARTRAGLGADGTFDRSRLPALKHLRVGGPFLVELDREGEIAAWLAPAPADALPLSPSARPTDDDPTRLCPLVPLTLPDGAISNLPGDLLPVGQACYTARKPDQRAPAFWHWPAFADWLRDPAERMVPPKALGVAGLQHDERTHVAINPDTGTARQGHLFGTRALTFTAARSIVRPANGAASDGQGSSAVQADVAPRTPPGPAGAEPFQRLALAITVSEEFPHFPGGPAPLGGERRVVLWRRSAKAPPSLPNDIRDEIARTGACRVVLLTPACFRDGFRPGMLLKAKHGVTPRLVAARVSGPLVASGWDLTNGTPKASRRLAPAGSVYFLRLEADTKEAVAEWAERWWLRAASDETHDRFAGFGLVALGAWSGEPFALRIEEVA